MKRMNVLLAGSLGFVFAVGTSSFGQQNIVADAPAAKATPKEVKALESVMAGFGNIKLNGLLQGWYQNDESGDPEGTFRLRRAEVKFSGDINDQVSWWLMFDPAQVREDDTKTASGTNTITSVGRKSVLQDFAVRLKYTDNLSLDVGQYKVPFGMEGLESSAKLDLIERATLTTQFKWADARDIGATLRGDFDLDGVKLQPAVGVYNGDGQNKLDANDGKMVVGRLTADCPVLGLHLGAAHANNEVGAAEVDSQRTGFEAKYTAGAVSVYGEYAFGESDGKDKETYYVTATCKVLESVQLAARYDWYDPDTDTDGDAGTETTAGVNYFIAKHNAKVQLNYVFRGEEGKSIDNDVVRVNLQVSF